MELHVHIHIHSSDDKGNVEKIREVTRRLAGMAGGTGPLSESSPFASFLSETAQMPTGHENVTVALGELDTATNALGARVQDLIDQINRTAGEGLTGPQTEAVLAQLGGFKTVLTGMGINPTQPFPSLPPTPPPVV